jgi:hypothetical protein
MSKDQNPDFSAFIEEHSLQGFRFKRVRAVFLPIVEYSVTVLVEKSIPANRYSIILLQLVQLGFASKRQLCEVLGISQDDFTLVHLEYLLSGNLLIEYQPDAYTLTLEGREFLNTENPVREVIKEDISCHYCPQLGKWLDVRTPIDNEVSDSLRKNFRGYNLVGEKDCNVINKEITAWKQGAQKDHIWPYEDNGQGLPTHQDVFCRFANQLFNGYVVYEISRTKKQGQKYIPFLSFEYENDYRQIRKDIRRFEYSTTGDTRFELESKLTEQATNNK